jgi:hypothetical protein
VRSVHGSIGLKPASFLCLMDKDEPAAGRLALRRLVYHFGELQPPPGGFDDFENPG